MTWQRQQDGSYTRNGWTIRRFRSSGSGQARPFQRVNVHATRGWAVFDPQGNSTATGSTLRDAQFSADRQIAFRAEAN